MKTVLLLLLSLLPAVIDADNVSWRHFSGGFEITMTASHPGTSAGTQLVLQATAAYCDEAGQLRGQVVSEPLVLTIGQSVWRREWLITVPSGWEASAVSGSGGIERRPDGLAVWVRCPNDGRDHVFVWKLRYQ